MIDLLPEQYQLVKSIVRTHAPEYVVYVFGSRATGNAKRFSDIDLAFVGKNPLPMPVLTRLTHDFSESDLPFRVDIVDWQTASESFRAIMKQHWIPL